MSHIITFYSYKGGVGRSMALANVAYELSKRSFKVLIVDWDLEAPGIERYFSAFKMENANEGLLQLLVAAADDINVDYKNYLWTINTVNGTPISLLHSGREKDPEKYSSSLQSFEWNDFFALKSGGAFLEKLRAAWHNDFDFVLIDSRTGLSDSSGICTILMPDILIPMFTANYQSLFGIRDAVKYIQAARQKLEVDRMALTVLPIPSRFGTRVEFKESQDWLDRIADLLKDCYTDWLPKWIEPKYILEQVKIPQIDYFSFGEKLAVVEQGTNDPEGMGFVFSKIALFLSSGFADMENFVGKEYYETKKQEYGQKKKEVVKVKIEDEFEYDVFVSFSRENYQWVRELLVPALGEYLNEILDYQPRLFFEIGEGNIGSASSISTNDSMIKKSKTCIWVISDSTSQSTLGSIELNSILERENKTGSKLLFPITYNRVATAPVEALPVGMETRYFFDFNQFGYEATLKSTKLRTQFGIEVEKLAIAIAEALNFKSTIKKPGATKQNEKSENDGLIRLQHLAEKYNQIRDVMQGFSSDRTKLMNNIVNEMKQEEELSGKNIQKLINGKSAGERLGAIAMLQKFPDFEHLYWLSNHVGDSEQPFIGYQASVALYTATRAFGKEHRETVMEVLKAANSNIQKNRFKDPNQIAVIDAAINELSLN